MLLAAAPASPRIVYAPCELDVERARRGDARAQRALYDAHAPAIYGYCLAFCRGDAASAADLTQDTFVAAFDALPGLADPGAFGGWVRVIARRRCLRWAGTRRREADLLAAYAPPEPDEPPPRDPALATAVLAACRDPKLREPAALYYGDPPLTTSEIAARLELTVTGVTTRLHRFRAWARLWALRQSTEADPA